MNALSIASKAATVNLKVSSSFFYIKYMLHVYFMHSTYYELSPLINYLKAQ